MPARKKTVKKPVKKTRRAPSKADNGFLTLSAAKFLVPVAISVTLLGGGIYTQFSAGQHTANSTPVQSARASATTTPTTSTPKPTPTPSPTPTPTTKPKAAPAPASTPVASPQAVAASQASPGKAVSGLTPAPVTTPSPTQTSSPPPTGSAGSGGGTLPAASAAYESTNWSGYFMNTASYTKVSGSWTAPNPTGNGSSTTADSTWIGIGGIGTGDLIQAGTENTVSANGKVSAAVFYELLPDAPVYPSSILVTPGDSLTASITEISSGQWTITITNLSTNKTFSVTVAYTSGHGSAEWVEEDPSYASGGLVPFDNFGTAFFSGSTAVANGSTVDLSSGNANALTMVDGSNNPIATPSVLGSDNKTFDVVRN